VRGPAAQLGSLLAAVSPAEKVVPRSHLAFDFARRAGDR
jgi:hypothetical protein